MAICATFGVSWRTGVATIPFTDPIDEEDLYFSPITSIENIQEANQRIFKQRDGFETAYRELKINNVSQVYRPDGKHPVVKVCYSYQSRNHEAFAYGALPKGKLGLASLVIPGSGVNQSLSIANKESANYHYGIMSALNLRGNVVYTLIKPNEDFLAWHDGRGKKLNGDVIYNWHLNRNGSYSASYLVDSLALVKWMKSCFHQTIVAGLSQGGAAALINARYSEPTAAIVASGHSILNDKTEWSGHSQIIGVPGYAELARKENLVRVLGSSPTQWMFSWGRGEIGTYRIEANEGVTANAIIHLSNVTIVTHEEGHVFPVTEIQAFLKSALSKQTIQK